MLKKYFTQKKQIRELTLDTLQKMNNIVTTASGLLDTAASVSDAFDAETINTLMEKINKIADNPELTTAYYQQVSRQAHEQKMSNAGS